jgi:alpha-galactosidase
MVDVKISIIGAGSAVFSLNLIKDLCLTPALQGSTISFMDINTERLDAVYALCSRYAREMRVRLKLEKTTDRETSLQDADFVITTALAAGHDRLREGWALARERGYRFGGSYHIMHDEAYWVNFYQFKLFDSIARDVLDICRDAWYIQLANPVLAWMTYLGRKYKSLKAVGLCHGFAGIYRLVEALGLDRDFLSFQIPGVNHFVWLTHFYHHGEDAFPRLDDWIKNKAPTYWQKCEPSDELGRKAVDLYGRFGVFPIGDTCTPGGGTWPWWYHTSNETEKEWGEDPGKWWDGYFSSGQKQMGNLIALSRDTSVKLTGAIAPMRSGEIIVPLVESLACDIPRVLQVNIQNSGNLVDGVPTDFEVEVPGHVSKAGVQGIKTHGLPEPLTAMILRERVAPVEIELEAYEGGKRELLQQLILSDPWTKSKEQADDLLNSILAIPYHQDMKQHYK